MEQPGDRAALKAELGVDGPLFVSAGALTGSSGAILKCLQAGLRAADLHEGAIQLVATTDRVAVGEMLTMTDYIDIIVPRGGKTNSDGRITISDPAKRATDWAMLHSAVTGELFLTLIRRSTTAPTLTAPKL